MVVILGSTSKSQRDCGTVRRRSGGGGGVGIESSCLSTISRSVKVMQHNKSVQAPVSVHGQKKKHCQGCKKEVRKSESANELKNEELIILPIFTLQCHIHTSLRKEKHKYIYFL